MTLHKRTKSTSSRSFLLQFSKRRPFSFVTLLCLVLYLAFNGALRQWRMQDNLDSLHPWEASLFPEAVDEEDETVGDFGESGTGSSPGWVLVEETRAAIVAAGGVPSTSLPPDERKAWDAANPCAGRQHLLKLWTKQKRFPLITNTTATQQGMRPSTLQQVLFREYANLHRTCTHGGDMEYVTLLFESGDESSSPCKFSVVEFGTHGVGNRLLWLVSAYQYALLTKRVLLIDTRSTMHNLLCEPFAGSSWALPANFPYSSNLKWAPPVDFQRAWDVWENRGRAVENQNVNTETVDKDGLRILDVEDVARERRDTMATIRAEIHSRAGLSVKDQEMTTRSVERRLMAGEDGSGNSLPPPQPPHFHHVRANEGWAPHSRFFCDNEQERLQQVKWINFINGCLYFLPDLFAIPMFQPVLEDLFPDRDPVTHLLRQLTLPVDTIWEMVRDVYIKHFSGASKVVGMQVRYRDGTAMYRTLNSLVNERISKCGLDHGLIPDPAASLGVSRTEGGPLVIFIASLFPGLREHLEREYRGTLKMRLGKMTSLKLVQLSKYGFQAFDMEGDHQAFLEIICLSLVDELLTSPQSTYGQIAQGLGALTPWLLDFQHRDPGDKSMNCVRGQSTDACFQFPTSKFTCPFNKGVDGKDVTEVVPYLKPCQDLGDGLQLVPSWSPSVFPP